MLNKFSNSLVNSSDDLGFRFFLNDVITIKHQESFKSLNIPNSKSSAISNSDDLYNAKHLAILHWFHYDIEVNNLFTQSIKEVFKPKDNPLFEESIVLTSIFKNLFYADFKGEEEEVTGKVFLVVFFYKKASRCWSKLFQVISNRR